jgi:hypothetical protein
MKERSQGLKSLVGFVHMHTLAGVPALTLTHTRTLPVCLGPAPLPCSTEPHSDEYYQYDVEACMRELGFQAVNTLESDPRHRVVLGHL